MCGSSSQQNQVFSEQDAFYGELRSEYSTVFAEDQGILKQLTDVFTPILQAGPGQEGFTGPEKTSFQTQINEGTASNFAAAHKALEEGYVGRDEFSSGEKNQQESNLAYSSAAEKSREELGVVQANYAEGSKMFDEAVSALGMTSGQLNPIGFSESTTGAGSAASKTANDIATAENSWMAPVFGAIGGIGAAALKHG